MAHYKSTKSREWILEGLPARNRFLMKRVAPKLLPAPSWARHGWRSRLYHKVLGGYYRLFKQATPPDVEAVHTKWDRPMKMRTQAKAPQLTGATPSAAVSWGKAMLDLTNGRQINLSREAREYEARWRH